MKKRTIGHEARTNRWGYAFVAPFIVVFLLFNLWPTINTFIVSFTDLKGLRNDYVFANAECPDCKGDGISRDDENEPCSVCKGTGKITPIVFNYSRLMKDHLFWGALKNTFIIWTFNFIPQLGLALILSIWLSDTRLNLAGKGLFRAVVYMPNLLMTASVALLFRSLFGAAGHVQAPANQFLRMLGIQASVLATGEQARILEQGGFIENAFFHQGVWWVKDAFNFFRSVAFTRGLTAFVQWWMWYGHTLIMLMAGITSIPVSLYESAVVDGANSRQTSWYITLPLLRPMMLYILVTSMIGGMQMFDIPFLLSDGGPNNSTRTTTLYQYVVAFRGLSDRSYGATISVGIFVVTIILAMIIYFFLQDRSEIQANKAKKNKGGAV